MKVMMEAYGCSLNRGEAEEFADGLVRQGHVMVETEGEADAFVIFTCGVIETTEKHMLKRIGQLALLRGEIMVCGCLANICPEEIMGISPRIMLFGAGEHMLGLDQFGGGRTVPVSPERVRNSAVAILPIASGCSGSCSYCITRHARGSLHSRHPDHLVERLAGQVENGAVEIQLCAQDTAVYGQDIGLGLADLVGRLEAVDGDFMMRIGMMNPASAMGDLENILGAYEGPKVFKFLHLPVQSGSDRILASMERRHTAADFEDIVQRFRGRFPGLTLSTDIITGFPGESEEDFQASLELMRRVKPDIINVTRFSSRPGTPAHDMGAKVPGWVSKERSRMLTEVRFELTCGNYEGLNGQIVMALATERRMEGTTFLRTRDYKPVVIDELLPLGPWFEVLLSGATRTHLIGARAHENV